MSPAYDNSRAYQIVRQSLAIHPDWTLLDHINYIRYDAGIDIASGAVSRYLSWAKAFDPIRPEEIG